MKKIFYIINGHWRPFIFVLTLGIIVNIALVVVDPYILKKLIDNGLMVKNFSVFYKYSIFTVIFGVAIRLCMFWYKLVSQKLKNRIIKALSLQLFKKYFKIPYIHVYQFDKGYYISRIYDEPSKIALSVVDTLINACIRAITFLISLCIVLYLSWRITVILIVIVPILYYLSKKFSPKIIDKSKLENKEEASLREIIGEAIAAYRELNIFQLFNLINYKIDTHLTKFLSTFYSRLKISEKYQAISQIFLSIAEAIVLIGAAYEVVQDRLTIGELFAFLTIFWKLISASTSLVSIIPDFSKLIGYIDRLIEFESIPENVTEKNHEYIKATNLNFKYESKQIFNNLNFSISNGKTFLIVGENGKGKSTLLNLITGFLKPTSGNIKSYRMQEISALLSPFNFPPATLEELIHLNKLSNDKKELFKNLIYEFKLKDKLRENLHSLSEGEKRKIQIIMTILKNARLYVFDEPLSHIDSESKNSIIRKIFEITEGKTVVMTLHDYKPYVHLFNNVLKL